jgi:hypothetical protein
LPTALYSQACSDIWFVFGTEDLLLVRYSNVKHQNSLSSEQENNLESTILKFKNSKIVIPILCNKNIYLRRSTMRQITHSQIQHLSLEFSNPERAAWLMRDFLNKSVKKTNQTLTKNLLIKLKNVKVGFVEVEEIAQHMLRQQKIGNKTRNEKYVIVKDLMKHKMLDAEKCVKESTKNLNHSKDNLSEVVRVKTVVREEFMNIVDREVNKVWRDGKKKNHNKTEVLIKKYVENETDPEVHEGVYVGDEILENLEAKNDHIKDNKAPIYGGIQGLTADQEEVLNLPPNHRTYPNLNLENFKTELEKCVIKAKWEKQRELRKQEEQNCKDENDEPKEVPKESVNDKRNTIHFRDLKATDLKNNKRIIMPNLDDDDEEIRRNNVKKELEIVFVNHMKEHCDKFGNVIENNLTEKQVKAIKTLKCKMKEEELVCFETDKTGKFALDTKANYIKKMEKHMKNDEIITMKEVRKIEKELNEHAEHWPN